jgi:arginyl-tRNA synthetase
MQSKLIFEIENELESIAHSLADFGPEFKLDLRIAEAHFGDLQINGILPFAKRLGKNPRALAESLCAATEATFPASLVEFSVAGPGFINIRFTPHAYFEALKPIQDDSDWQALLPQEPKKTIIIDYSSPNTAKQMHVGHLRSLVIGHALKRILELKGHKVIGDNHLGDWGTQFGILLMQIKAEGYDLSAPHADPLEDLEGLYKRGSVRFKESTDVQNEARQELVKLQSEEPENFKLWEAISRISYEAFEKIYKSFGVDFELVLGESFYRNDCDKIYKELTGSGLAQESEGALVVFHEEHPRFSKTPFIIRKADGASNYATTDLATILHRVEALKADEVLYVVDGRQQDHFEQLFLTTQKWFAKRHTPCPKLQHIAFGMVLGEDGKAIKTRSGEPIRLKDLMAEGVERAEAIVAEKNPELDAAERRQVAEVIGIAAIRYADLSQNRSSDYTFQWDKLLAMEGNTAPYLLYAVARIHSIFRKGAFDLQSHFEDATAFETDGEITLARKLLQFPRIFQQVAQDLRPHTLCLYLYELACAFSSFYKTERILGEPPAIQARRLMLAKRTLTLLTLGLNTLGIPTLEKM